MNNNFELSESMNPFFLIGVIGAVVLHFLFLTLIHRVKGGKYWGERKSDKAITFKTDGGEFLLTGAKDLLYWRKFRKDQWRKIPFDNIKKLSISRSCESAKLKEFLLGGWNIWDFSRTYTDVTNGLAIQIELHDGDPLILTQMKQYEQREWMLGQMMHDFSLKILAKLELYKEIEEEGEKELQRFQAIFHHYHAMT
ncbi:MAG TPA: hypothetical protein DCL66_08100 [Gammaproteobacteria bacterium]|mgnify:FL=1|nr:hypothetical protein [Gammaproteobacteria bacterium]|tara:strand:+ start:209 stop:796 length:588 start_codon:yes stop_codon:yes gene_type:complete